MIETDNKGTASVLEMIEEENQELNSALDGMQNLLLSLSAYGIDISEPKFIKGIDMTLKSIYREYTGQLY
jgi:hypothetical protein